MSICIGFMQSIGGNSLSEGYPMSRRNPKGKSIDDILLEFAHSHWAELEFQCWQRDGRENRVCREQDGDLDVVARFYPGLFGYFVIAPGQNRSGNDRKYIQAVGRCRRAV